MPALWSTLGPLPLAPPGGILWRGSSKLVSPIGITDGIAFVRDYSRTINDPVGISGAQTFAQGFNRAATDSLGMTDSANWVIVSPVAFDALGAGYSKTTSATSVSGSWPETVAAGASIVVWAAVTVSPTTTPYTACTRTVTYNGTSMVSQGAQYWGGNTPNFGWLECFTLAGAGTGSSATFNFSVTGTSLTFGGIAANSESYVNASSFGTPVFNFGSSTSPTSGAVSSATGQMVAQAFAVGLGNTSTPTTSGYSQTSRYSQKAVASASFGGGITSLGTILTMGDAPGAASVNFAETISTSGSWASMAIPLVP